MPTTSDATNSFAIGDVDGDGDTDVVVVNAGQSFLLLNDGHGRFTDATADHLPTLALTAMAAMGSSPISRQSNYRRIPL